MANTTKWEHRSDPIRSVWKMERKARPAGRLIRVIEWELEAEADHTVEFPITYVPFKLETEEWCQKCDEWHFEGEHVRPWDSIKDHMNQQCWARF